MLANELIDLLERRGLLDQEIIEALRDQLQQSGARIKPEAMAKLLVDNGHLTRFQATKLIGEIRSGDYADPDDDLDAAAGVQPDEDLDLLPDENDASRSEDAEELVEAEPADEDEDLVEAIPVVEAVPVDAIDAPLPLPPRLQRPTKKPAAGHHTVWDSFWIYGIAAITVVLLLLGGVFYFIINKEDAAAYMARADELYSQQNYGGARTLYQDFLDDFGQDDSHSSLARVRIGMSQIFAAAKSSSDPTTGLETAQQVLPQIENEKALDQERPNLAGLLVEIAEQIAAKADNASETELKKQLLSSLDAQIQLMQNPMYITSSLRQSLATRIQAVTESRARIERAIGRNERLAATRAAMEQALEKQQTKVAYDLRSELTKEYPELQSNDSLRQLVVRASELQQQLVKPSGELPDTAQGEAASEVQRSIVLANRSGDGVPGLAGRAVYFRARGSILAFAADNGRLLWRRFVGYRDDHDPVALGETPADGVLLSDGASLEVQRVAGDQGQVQWRTRIGEPFSAPVTQDQSVYLSTATGRLIALDAETGEARWASQIPQPLEVSPGAHASTQRLYLPGDHSNLYVLDSRNGKCTESLYLGHAEGTIRVPPVPLLGHLFVMENAGPNYALVHILRTNEKGDGLERAQNSIRLDGNVIVAPLIQRRRLILLTDRGQVKVLDVEPTAERDKVTVVADQVSSYESPTATQMAVGTGQMWITGTRIGRYELQINTGRVVRDWVKHDGDAFIAPPRLLEGTLFHARVLRGTQGVRVTASEPETGDVRWQSDVGVPVSMLARNATGDGIHAVTSQAALYSLDATALAEGSTTGPVENPGGNGVAMRFEHPLQADDQTTILVNQEGSGQIAVYNPSRQREKLRVVTLALPPGKPTAPPVVAGGGLLLPLDTGRVVLMNYQSGGRLGSPFQPAADPETPVQWYQPVASPTDPDQVVIGDDRGKIYRLRVGDQIRALTEADLSSKLLGPAAAVQQHLAVTTAGPARDILLLMDINSLEETKQIMLDGHVVWGPLAVGDQFLLQTDDGNLRAYGPDGESRWAVALPAGQPVGTPTLIESQLLVSGAAGWLVTLDPSSGAVRGQIDIGQPLAGAPLAVGSNLLVPGSEGVVYITTVPSAPADAPASGS